MALELRRLPQAQRVALDIWLYVAADNVSAADRLLERIDSAAWELSNQPMSGRARPELAAGIRSYPIGGYAIFYRLTAESIEIVRILSAYRETAHEMFDSDT